MSASSSNHVQPVSPQTSSQDFWTIPELLRYIREGMRGKEFAALCLVSREIYGCANPILYERISLDLDGDKGFKTLSALQRSLVGNSGFSRLVKNLHVRFHNLGERSHLTTLSNIIRKCSELRELYILDRLPLPPSELLDLSKALGCVTSLSHFGFDIHGTRWPDQVPGRQSINDLILIYALKYPIIESVIITLQEGPESPLKNSILPTSDTITRLSLNEAYLGVGTLCKIITAVPRLRHLDLALLRYADPIYEHVSSQIDFKELGDALAVCSTTLESLKLAIEYEARTALDIPAGGGENSAWGPFGAFPSLGAWERLKSLELAPEALLGWYGEESVTFSDVLPNTLEYLCFRWDFGGWYNTPWDFSSVCEETGKYLNSSQRAPLKGLAMTCFEFEVEDAEMELESIKSLCRRLGISFSLNTLED